MKITTQIGQMVAAIAAVCRWLLAQITGPQLALRGGQI